MFCPNCGNQVSEQAVSCPNCGHPIRTAPSVAAMPRKSASSAVAALILGIATFVVPCVGLATAPLAIIYANKAKRELEADPELEGHGLAQAGLILGWIGVGLVVLGLLFFILVFAGSTTTTTFGSLPAGSFAG